MNTQIIKEEVKSKALQEIVSSLVEVVDRVKSGQVTYQQANVEIVGHKHVLQSVALDWSFNRKIAGLKRGKAG